MKNDVMILGQNAVYSCDTNSTGLNNNVLVVAGTGCGKTMSIMEARLLTTTESSLVVTCTKRQLVDKYTEYFQKLGYEVGEINFCKPQLSTQSYDPMAYVKSYQDIVFLAQSIIKADPQKKTATHVDPYWDQAACTLLSALIAKTMMEKKKANFNDVLECFDRIHLQEANSSSAIETGLEEEFCSIARKHPNCFAVTNWNNFISLPIRTAGCVYSTLASTISAIFTPELRKMMCLPNKADFRSLASRKSVLFVTTSAVNPALHSFIATFYGQLFKQLFEYGEEQPDGRLPIDVTVLADEFAVGAPVPNIGQLISVFRAKGISTVLLIQSESQLISLYGEADATTIINNSDTYIFMGGNDLTTAQNISKRVDKPLQDVLYLPLGREYICRRGTRPVETQRYDILNNKKYQEVTKAYENRIRQQKIK